MITLITIRYTIDIGTVITRDTTGYIIKDRPIVDRPNKLFI